MSRGKIPVPVVISKEGKWFVASSPTLDIATQGKTEKEVKENMADLISDYFRDPDTPKPRLSELMDISITKIPVTLHGGASHRKIAAAAPA
jgi:predicted RNase H-like HicB family nuclease